MLFRNMCSNFHFCSYTFLQAATNAYGIPFFLIAHSTTFLGTLSNAFSRSTKHIFYFFWLAKYSSCISLKMKIASIVPFLAKSRIACQQSLPFFSIFSQVHFKQFSLHVLVHALFMISRFPFEIGIATLVTQSSGIHFPSSILWQSSVSTLIPTSPIARINFA